MGKNIILIGMAGSGKSTLGRRLARRLGMDFFDPDRYIEESEDNSLQELIDELGEGGFVLLEERYLMGINLENTVIAPGGSSVLSEIAMEHLKKQGLVIYLDVPYKLIKKRLRGIYTRGIVGLEKFDLKEVYDMRKPLYEKYADVVVRTEGKSRREILEEVEARVKARRG